MKDESMVQEPPFDSNSTFPLLADYWALPHQVVASPNK